VSFEAGNEDSITSGTCFLMPLQKPNFLIIGAQKCGTSWLQTHLSDHHEVFMPPRKDLEFFSYESHLRSPGIGKYLEHFDVNGPATAIGEATASYFWTHSSSQWCVMPDGFQTNIPGVVKAHLGAGLKLIVSLRHPARRAVSAYLHYLNVGELPLTATFSDGMKYIGTIDMGFYARHLAAWLRYFDLSQILVLTLEEDIRARPGATMSRICEFLDIEERPADTAVLAKPVYAGIPKRIDRNGVFADLREVWSRHGIGNHPSNDEFTQILNPEQWRELKLLYHADVEQLDLLLGTSLMKDWCLSE
jgi:hypothetical protein